MSIPDKITRALDVLRQADAKSHLREGAGDITIKVISSKLGKSDYPQLPEDYEVLLRQACGILGPYFILLGPGGMETAGGGLQPSFFEESESFNRWNDDDEPKVLVLGKMSGGVVLVHKDGKYHIVDESSRDVFESYDDIGDFIIDTVTRKDKAIRDSAAV